MKPEQITAWALDEASAEERQQLEAALRDNPKAKQAAEDTKNFCHFLLAELHDESLALTDAQRERLKTQPVEQSSRLPGASETRARPTQWRFSIVVKLAMAASIALGGLWTWQAFGPQQTAKQIALVEELEHKVLAATLRDDDEGKAHAAVAVRRRALQPEKPAMRETRKEPTVLDSLVTVVPRPLAEQQPAESPAARPLGLNYKLGRMTADDVVALKKMQDQSAYGLNLDIAGAKPAAPAASAPGLIVSNPSMPVADPAVALSFGAGTSSSYSDAIPSSGGMTKAGNGTLTLSGANTYTGATTVTAGTLVLGAINSPAGAPARPVIEAKPQADTRYFTTLNAPQAESREKAGIVGGWAQQKEERTATRLSDASNETYTRIIENELKDVAREPLSTLSIDVDTASYANVRRFLNQNMAPPPDAVRIEELVNYFPTSEEGPAAEAKEPFGVRVEMAPCPWQPEHRLTRIAIKGREMDKDRKASNLVFLVDVSGSMDEPLKLPLVQQSLRMLTEQLGEGDRVTMVAYAGSSGLVLPPTSGEKKGEIIAAIDRLKAGGSTHGSAGIQLAYEQAVSCFIKGGVNRVILCTDGDFNVGVSSPKELEKLITEKAKSGVFLSVLGFGSGNLKDRTMETLADKGNGNYAYIDSLSEARKVLVEQMSGTLITIAKDVKIQVEFNPAAVRSYRLIGYENRLLAKEDFNNDAKDAGEIGAGHSVVALYEVVPANLPPGAEPRPLVDGLKYQTANAAPVKLADAAKNGEVMTVKLRYKEPEGMTSRLLEVPVKDEGKTLTASSEEFKFSAAVAGFGLLLRDSSYKGNLSWETVRKLAIDGKGSDRLGYRGEFLQLIDKARSVKPAQP